MNLHVKMECNHVLSHQCNAGIFIMIWLGWKSRCSIFTVSSRSKNLPVGLGELPESEHVLARNKCTMIRSWLSQRVNSYAERAINALRQRRIKCQGIRGILYRDRWQRLCVHFKKSSICKYRISKGLVTNHIVVSVVIACGMLRDRDVTDPT